MGIKSFNNTFLSLTLLVCLTGCFGHALDTLKRTTPQGSAFHQELFQAYLNFSQSEADQFDWIDSDHFAKKGVKAAKGEDIEPEMPESWNVPETMHKSLHEARKLLLETVNDKTKEADPKNAARAYALYDCWLEELEENWQVEHIESCRNQFFETIDFLSVLDNGDDILDIEVDNFEDVERDAEQSVFERLMQELKSEPATVEDDLEEAKSSYAIFFNLDSSKINDEGMKTIVNVINDLQNLSEYFVKLNGYTDRSGDKEYNLKLSQQRADNVKQELVRRGVVEDSIAVEAYGETNPKVQTEDGKTEPKNRIVEIFLH